MAPLIPELFLSPEAAKRLGEDAAKLPGWGLSGAQADIVNLLMNGGFFPLKGFMPKADATRAAQEMRLASGALWPLPVTLRVDRAFADRIAPGDDIALLDGQGPVAVMSVTDLWREGETVHLGGKVKGLRVPDGASDLTPNRSRREAGGASRIDAAKLRLPELDWPALGWPADPQRAALLRGLMARNFGATHVCTDDPLLRAGFESVGLVVEAS